MQFIKAYIQSMRLYYAFVTGIAGWLGMAFYEFIATSRYKTIEVLPSVEKKGLILVLLFLSWGINQIFNDYLGLKEDRINAPERPMVTGELNPHWALALSTVLLTLSAVLTWIYLEPVALLPLFVGILLNILYEYAKGYGIFGNIVFGLMITMCTVYGYLSAGPIGEPFVTKSRLAVLILVLVMNALMTFYTYFKDYAGDKLAGKKTLVVKYGIEKSKTLAILSSFLPSVLFIIFYLNGFIGPTINKTFKILAYLTVFLQVWTGYLYYKNPEGEETYYSLATNFRACTCGQAALIALFNPELATLLFIVAYMFVGFLFDMHKGTRS